MWCLLDLSSQSGSGVIQNSVAYMKWSAPSKDHIIWYQSFRSCYRFYPIQFLFFFLCHLCLRFLFASCFVLIYILFCSCLRSCLRPCCVLVCVLLRSCLHSCLRSCLCSCFHSCLYFYSCSSSRFFQIMCQKKSIWILFQILFGDIWLTGKFRGFRVL